MTGLVNKNDAPELRAARIAAAKERLAREHHHKIVTICDGSRAFENHPAFVQMAVAVADGGDPALVVQAKLRVSSI